MSISPEELERRKNAPSTTPEEERHKCPQCGYITLKRHNDKWGTANGQWYCDHCHEHVDPEVGN